MEVSNFIAAAFVGRIEDEHVAADALRMLRVPPGVGYEAVLSRLSPRDARGDRSGLREFVMRDVDGNVDRIRVDVDHLPHVLAALDTTAVPHPDVPPPSDQLPPDGELVGTGARPGRGVGSAGSTADQDLHADLHAEVEGPPVPARQGERTPVPVQLREPGPARHAAHRQEQVPAHGSPSGAAATNGAPAAVDVTEDGVNGTNGSAGQTVSRALGWPDDQVAGVEPDLRDGIQVG